MCSLFSLDVKALTGRQNNLLCFNALVISVYTLKYILPS